MVFGGSVGILFNHLNNIVEWAAMIGALYCAPFALTQGFAPAAEPMTWALLGLPLRQSSALVRCVRAGEYRGAGAAHAHIGLWCDGLQGFVDRFDFGCDDECSRLHVVGKRCVCVQPLQLPF